MILLPSSIFDSHIFRHSAANLTAAFEAHNVPYHFLSNTKDIWLQGFYAGADRLRTIGFFRYEPILPKRLSLTANRFPPRDCTATPSAGHILRNQPGWRECGIFALAPKGDRERPCFCRESGIPTRSVSAGTGKLVGGGNYYSSRP